MSEEPPMRALDEQLPPDRAGDAFGAALLGAWALARRSGRLFARRAAPDAPRVPPDDPALLATLGWIALRRTLARRLVEAAPRPPGAGADAAAPPTPRRPPGLLR